MARKSSEDKSKQAATQNTSEESIETTELRDVAEAQVSTVDMGRYWSAILLIGAGIVVLLNNFEILPWTVWTLFLQFWPIILIAIGLDLVLRRYLWARIGILTLFVLGLVGVIGFSVLSNQPSLYDEMRKQAPWLPSISFENGINNSEESFHHRVSSEDFGTVSSRQLKAEIGMGKLEMRDVADDYFADFRATNVGVMPEVKTNLQDEKLLIELLLKEGRAFPPFLRSRDLDYDISIGRRDIPTDFMLDIGAGKGVLNLEQLRVNEMAVNVGAGQFEAHISESSVPVENLKIDVGVGSVKVYIPQNVAVRAKHDVGLGTFKVGEAKVDGDGDFETDNISEAEKILELDVNVGVGSVEIIRE